MTRRTSADAFTAFVDRLVAHLDDHEARGADVAAGAYLSRYHFDRIVAATAGETPGRFRRRILLERAAYRLATTNLTVLDVAVEAGYSSHEAFTRAFRRAYGTGPARWREAPGRVLLDTPNGVHFHPPGGLRLPADTKVTSMDLIAKMVDHHVWLIGALVERAATLPPRQLDVPIELSVEGIDQAPTIRSLLSRLVGQMDMWMCSMASRPYDFAVERDEPLDSIRERLDRVGPEFSTQVGEILALGRLDDTFVDATCDPPEVFTYGGMLAHVLTYAAHRRTLVSGALHTAGVTDLEDDPLRWMARSA